MRHFGVPRACRLGAVRSGMAGQARPGTHYPLLSNAGHGGMETACPICKERLEAHDDCRMAECGLELMQKDYGDSYAEDFVWMCPECDGRVDDHDDAMLARCSRMLVLGDYSDGVRMG